MKKFKKILLGALSALTLGLFVATGTQVNAATELEYSFNHFSDTGYSNAECTTVHSKVGSVTDLTWYHKKTTSSVDLVVSGFSTAARMNNNNGVIDRIGNIANTTYAAIDSKYKVAGVGESTHTYGLVFGLNAVSNVKAATITFNNNKGQGNGDDLYYVLVSTNNITYSLLTSGALGQNSNNSVSLSVTNTNGTYTVSDANNHSVSLGETNALGYAILCASSKNIQFDAWTTAYTIESQQDVGTYHKVYYHDINGTILTDLTQEVEENTNATAPLAGSSAPTIVGKTFASWNIGSKDGEAVGETINMGTEDIHLYATYNNAQGYTVASQYKLDQTMLSYAATNVGTSELNSDLAFGDSIYSVQSGAKFGSANSTISGRNFSSYISTGTLSATQKSVVINAPSAGYLIAYVKSGSTSSARQVNLFPMNSTTASVTGATIPATSPASSLRIVYEIPSAGQYRIGTGGNIYIFEMEFSTEQPVSTPVLEQQENSTGSAIRYIATLTGVTDITKVASWKAVFTLEGKKGSYTTEDNTILYTAVSGTNGKASADNTYYLVATLNNIPATFNTKKLTCEFVVTLSNEQVISSNKLNYTVNVTA